MSRPIALPRTQAQKTAVDAVAKAIAACDELMRFYIDGAHWPHPGGIWSTNRGDDPVTTLAEAARLAIVTQGGPHDLDQRDLLVALLNFLEPDGATGDAASTDEAEA